MNQPSRSLFTLQLLSIAFLVFLLGSATYGKAQHWNTTGSLGAARSLHTATPQANGKILVVGGINVINPCCANTGVAELYDPATGQWIATGAPSTPRSNHIAVRLHNGKVLIASGNGDPFSNILLPNGKVLAAGGSSANTGGLLRSSELYDPATGNWTGAAELTAGRQNHTATLLSNGKILATAGSGAGQLTSAELFNSGAATVTSVSAANFTFGGAPESIVAAFGSNLATSVQMASGLPLPTTLAGVSVRVRDSAGIERPAPLFFVSPSQINYQIPPGTAAGSSLVAATGGGNFIAGGVAEITIVAPGLFAANSSGQGFAAAIVFRLKANGAQSYEPVALFDPALNRFVATPIDLGPESDQVFLILYGTGIKFRSALSAIICAIGGVGGEVLFADAAPGFVGLDQVNVRLPRSLIGRGEVDVALTVDGKAANSVRVSIR